MAWISDASNNVCVQELKGYFLRGYNEGLALNGI